MKKKNGFTLIELLAVIIILGILMIIAIPSVSKYISGSKDSAYINTAKQIIAGARNLVNDGKHEMFDTNVTYYIETYCIKTENANKSPYGEFDKAYVVVTYNGHGYTYHWTGRDDTGHGVRGIIRQENLTEDVLETDIEKEEVSNSLGIDGRKYYVLISESSNCMKGELNPVTGYNNSSTGQTAPVCIRATTLHTEQCTRTTGGCYATGYYADGSKGTTTINYGNDPKSVDASKLTAGDAFDCDVNNDGIYNPQTERFYYIKTKNNNAVLIYYTNISNNGTSVTPTASIKYAYDSSNVNNLGPQTAYLQLPHIDQWDNPGLVLPGKRIILNEKGENTTNKGNTTISNFTYTDRAARFLTYQDIETACNISLRVQGNLDSCIFLMENTAFASPTTTATVNGIWLENPLSTSTKEVLGTNFEKRYIGYANANSTGNGVRPVIEVPKNLMSLEKQITSTIVSFDANGGTFSNGRTTNDIEYYPYSRMIKNGDYLIPTKEGKHFAGWKSTKKNQVYSNFSNYVANESDTMVAQWSDAITYTCIRVDSASKLHTEQCTRTSNYCAGVVGSGNLVTYGNIGMPGVLRAGDAFDCDLNGNGVYDERFYYVSDYFDPNASANSTNVFDNTYAVLVYYSFYKSGTGAVNTGVAYSSNKVNTQGPVTAMNDLPTTSEWSNVSLKSTSRQLLIEYNQVHNATTSGSVTYPVLDYSGKAARLLTGQEIMKACKIAYISGKNKELDGCTFLFEKTNYADAGYSVVSVWLETPYTNTANALRANAEQRSLLTSTVQQTNKGLKPAIEIPVTKILY